MGNLLFGIAITIDDFPFFDVFCGIACAWSTQDVFDGLKALIFDMTVEGCLRLRRDVFVEFVHTGDFLRGAARFSLVIRTDFKRSPLRRIFVSETHIPGIIIAVAIGIPTQEVVAVFTAHTLIQEGCWAGTRAVVQRRGIEITSVI